MTEQLIMEENGKRYRMLQVGETIEEGDEVNVKSGGWLKVNMRTPITLVVRSATSGYMTYGYYRRPITDHSANDPVNVATAILEAGK